MAPYFRQTKLLCAANDWVRVDGGPGRAGQMSYIVLLVPACIPIRRRRMPGVSKLWAGCTYIRSSLDKNGPTTTISSLVPYWLHAFCWFNAKLV